MSRKERTSLFGGRERERERRSTDNETRRRAERGGRKERRQNCLLSTSPSTRLDSDDARIGGSAFRDPGPMGRNM